MAKKLYLLFFIIPIFMSCEIDHGLGILGSGVYGKLIMQNIDAMPENIESVRIVALSEIDINNINLGDVVISLRPVNLSQDEPEYYIPAPLDTYQVLAAVYKEKGKEWNYANILSYYGLNFEEGETTPLPVSLTKDHPYAYDIDIICDWERF